MVVKAVYENGIFRPLAPVMGVREREEVELIVSEPQASRILVPARVTGTESERLLAEIAGTLTPQEARQMSRAIEEEFEQVEDDERPGA